METFVRAAQILFRSNDADERREADAWLQTCQQGYDGWQVVENILNQPDKVDAEVATLAAQTLRAKIQLDYEQLEENHRVALRGRLFDYLIAYRCHPQIRTQIALSIADMVIHTEWSDAVSHFMERLADDNSTLLLLLQYLPEENRNEKLLTETRKRYEARERLRDDSSKVLAFCENVVTPRKQVMRCFLAWHPFCTLSCEELARCRVILECFTTILDQDDDIAEASTDVLVGVLRSNRDILEHLMPSVLKLGDTQTENIDTLTRLVRVFTETGECLLTEITLGKNLEDAQVNNLLRLLHRAVELPPDCAWMAWDFWRQLSDVCDDRFQPIFLDLLHAAMRCAEYREDSINSERSPSLCSAVSEGIVRVLGATPTLEHLAQHFTTQTNTLEREACLYLVSLVAACRPKPHDSQSVRIVLRSVAEIVHEGCTKDAASHCLTLTALKTVGAMSDWITLDDSCSQQFLRALSNCREDLWEEGVHSFLQLCRSGKTKWKQLVPQLFELLQKPVSKEGYLCILEGVALCVSQSDEFGAQFEMLLRLCGEDLDKLRMVVEFGVPRLRGESSGKGKVVGCCVVETMWPIMRADLGQSALLLVQCMRCVPEHCATLLPELGALLENADAPTITIIECLLDTYQDDVNLHELFRRFTERVFQQYQTEGMEVVLALGADFYYLCSKFVRRGFRPNPNLVPLAQSALMSNQKEIVEAGAALMEELLRVTLDNAKISADLIQSCFFLLRAAAPAFVVSVIPSLLLSVRSQSRAEFQSWIEQGLQSVGTCASIAEKADWMRVLLDDSLEPEDERALDDATKTVLDIAHRCEQVALRNRGIVT